MYLYLKVNIISSNLTLFLIESVVIHFSYQYNTNKLFPKALNNLKKR